MRYHCPPLRIYTAACACRGAQTTLHLYSIYPRGGGARRPSVTITPSGFCGVSRRGELVFYACERAGDLLHPGRLVRVAYGEEGVEVLLERGASAEQRAAEGVVGFCVSVRLAELLYCGVYSVDCGAYG